jgi:hypothetical protein
MTGIGEYNDVCLDCADPQALAVFYQRLGGGEVTYSDENYGAVTLAGGANLNFQRIDGHRPVTWPEGTVPQQFHLDFLVEDLDKAEAQLLELGAGKPGFQPGGDRWRVLTDPAGHPFCVCTRST